MMAIRLARAFTRRKTLLRFTQHFHGWNDNVVGTPAPEGTHPHALGIPDETLSNVIVIPQNDPELLRQTLREEDVAAVILEPTGASWGSVPLDPAMLPLLREETSATGALLIFDEVITGFRVSPGGVQAATGITPDLTTMAKILAGGLPGGAVAGRQDVMSLINFSGGSRSDFGGRIPHPGTFNANPLSAAAGSTALAIVATGEPGKVASDLCAALIRELNRAIVAAGVPGCAYGQASMFHIILGAECPPPFDGFEWDWQGRPGHQMPQMSLDVFWGLRRSMLNEGVDLMGAGGMLSSAHAQEDIDFTVEAFRRTLASLKEEQLL
jgi:glutamate-1-semialdehyde 2,1-aminomutase